MVASAPHHQIGYLLRSYPRLTQTFVLNEILALEKLGWELQIFALTDPHEPQQQAQAGQVRAPVSYLEAGAALPPRRGARISPSRYWAAWMYVASTPELDRGYTTSNRYECLRQAVRLAERIEAGRSNGGPGNGGSIRHLHAHFAHDPALIALLVHMLTGLPYSFTAHARDLYQTPPAALVRRAKSATTVVTCCQANAQYLIKTLPAALHPKIQLVYHGVDPQVFHPAGPPNGRLDDEPLILSIGRLVEKKGYRDLIQVLSFLQGRGCRFRAEIYGEGPLKDELQAQIELHGLGARVKLAGVRIQADLLPVYQRAAIFALTPGISADGDRDGIPNVLLEAMACGLPVVSTTVGGIPELIEHGVSGLLYAPHDVQGLAAGLAELLDDPDWRHTLGDAGRQRVEARFDSAQSARQLEAIFGRQEAPA